MEKSMKHKKQQKFGLGLINRDRFAKSKQKGIVTEYMEEIEEEEKKEEESMEQKTISVDSSQLMSESEDEQEE